MGAGVAREEKREKRDGKGEGKGDGDDYEFIPADFDEDAFIHREMVSFRTTSILFLWGIVAALVSWALFAALDGAKVGWLVGLLVCAAFGFALKWLFPALKADIKHFARREWLGTAFLFFFTWLAFFILAVNPPVSDFAPPRVDVHAAPPLQEAGGDVVVDAFFEDNGRVTARDLHVLGPAGEVPADMQEVGPGHFRFTAAALPVGQYVVAATASDAKGHEANATITFAIVETLLDVDFPDGRTLDGPGDRVIVDVRDSVPPCTKKLRVACVRTVYLDQGDGTRVTLEHDAQVGAWTAVPNHAGWKTGNNTFDVVAEVMDAYAGSVRVDGGRMVDGPYSVEVTAATGDYEPKVRADPSAPRREVPGLGPVALGIGLLALVALARRRA